MTKLRERILNFFDNISKKDYKMKELDPILYGQFLKLTKNYPDRKYYRIIQNIRDRDHYILYRLSDSNKINMFINYCKINKIPMSGSILKYYRINIDKKNFYIKMNGSFPKCTHCNNDLPSLKVQLYTTLEDNKGRFCSIKCKKDHHLEKVTERLKENKCNLIFYSSEMSIITCQKCGTELQRNTSNIFTKNMFQCNVCAGEYVKGQFEIYEFLKEFDPNIKLEVREIIGRKVIDIYSEKFKIAIEYDGLMYHSYGVSSSSKFNKLNINKKHHVNRMVELNKEGIRLFRVWDIEWLFSKEKWKNILKNAFLNNNSKIYARDCKIKDVNQKEAKMFMNNNHMQGYASAKYYYGLYKDNILISLMTFGTSIRSKGEWELLRFCSLNGINCIGGASKLLKHFERTHKPESLISYANLRWSEGKIYDILGFNMIKIVEPSYFYFKPNYDKTGLIYHRTKFTRTNIEKYCNEGSYGIKSFEKDNTEFENMFNSGYRIIYDCGMKKYVKYYD